MTPEDLAAWRASALGALVDRLEHDAVQALAGGSSVPYLQLLVDFSAFSAAPFRRTTQPTSPYYATRATHITWQPVGQEWHAVTGPFDGTEVPVHANDQSTSIATHHRTSPPSGRIMAGALSGR